MNSHDTTDFFQELLNMVSKEKSQSYAQGFQDALSMQRPDLLVVVDIAIREIKDYVRYEHGDDKVSKVVFQALDTLRKKIAGEPNE